MARKSKTERLGRVRDMGAGLRKYFAGQTLSFSAMTMTVDDILGEFAATAAQAAKVTAARNAWRKEVAAERTLHAKRVTPMMQGLELLLRTYFGRSNPTLLEFGITPYSRRKPSLAVKTAAITKARATRDARGTSGKRRRTRR